MGTETNRVREHTLRPAVNVKGVILLSKRSSKGVEVSHNVKSTLMTT